MADNEEIPLSKRVRVVAGIIWNADQTRLLIARRPDHLHKGGYWEFPGGKIEEGETGPEALSRELHEELGIRFRHSRFFRQVLFDYPEKTVEIDFYEVFAIDGSVNPNEGQEWCWASPVELSDYHFPEANQTIVDAIRAAD